MPIADTKLLTLPDTAHHHDHEYHQLVFGLEGDTEFDIQGRGQQVKLGHGCLVPSTTDHAFCGLGDNRIVVINIPSDNLDLQVSSAIGKMFDRPSYFTLDPQRQVLLQSISREMLVTPKDSPLLHACGQALLLSVNNFLSEPKPRQSQAVIDARVLDQYIALNMHRKISIAELAGLVYLSPSHFHTRFKEIFGITPHQYVLQKRLECAKRKLQEGWTVMRAADHTGFSSQSAFTHAFRDFFDITPAKCRSAAINTADVS
jgi:AraC-like DNA-binding protein